MDSQRIVKVRITGDLIGAMLCLPEGAKVVRIEPGDWNGRLGPDATVDLYIKSDDLPEVEPGVVIPQANPAVLNNRYAVDGLVKAIDSLIVVWDSEDAAQLARAWELVKGRLQHVKDGGGSLVKFLDWNLTVPPAISLAVDGEKT